MLQLPARGEIWHGFLDPVQGREQGRDRPCLIVSIDPFNHGPSDLAVIVPLTTTERRTPFHVTVEPPDGGLPQRSFVMCEAIRSVSIERLVAGPIVKRYGVVSGAVMSQVEDRLRVLLKL